MTEINEPGLRISAVNAGQVGEVPPVVWEHARAIDETLHLRIFAVALALVACVQAALIVACWARPLLPVYVLGG